MRYWDKLFVSSGAKSLVLVDDSRIKIQGVNFKCKLFITTNIELETWHADDLRFGRFIRIFSLIIRSTHRIISQRNAQVA